MKKKLLAMLLTLCMTLSLLPMPAGAVEIPSGSGLDKLGIRQISEKSYAITPDVKEYEWVLNNSALTQQMMGHVMEVKVGEGSKASVAVGYGDYNIEAIAGGTSWTMRETTKQAQSMQSRRNTNVVGAINAGGYDMSNGRPGGAFIMDGTVINRATSTTFWIDMEGNAHITSAQECNAALDSGNVREAVSGFGDIFKDGHATSGLDNFTRASRTAIGIKADGTVVMLMVDGRQAPYSVGMTMAEVGAAMEALGCEQAVNLDGGGSSTFATQREGEPETEDSAGLTLRCRPSDGYERRVSNTLMVLSTAKPTGEFDHAVLTPNNAIYTPGSKVQFTATGVDGAGGGAAIPAGAEWKVLSGGGSIDTNGLYTAPEGCGKVEVGLTVGGKTVGQTGIQLQWPDTLGFTNASVSIDFGKSSDMTFKPTWHGQEVIYKDGDFVWNIAPTYYKFDALVDPISNNGKGDFSMPITPDALGKATVVVEYYAWGTGLTYTSTYRVTDLAQSEENGETRITAKVEYVSSGGAIGEKKPQNLEQTFSAGIGKFAGNVFVADEKNSLRGKIHVALRNDPSVSGSVDVAVGMEPFVLMDFEDHNEVSAEKYWSTHVGSSSTGANSHLLADEVKSTRLWIRDTTGKGVLFPEGYNKVVSASEDENVRFGQYAFKLGYDFTKIDPTTVAAADFGFSGDLYVETVQPTKIGMWIKVPDECAEDNSVLKAVLKGGASERALATAYMKLEKDNTISYVDGSELVGTAAYVQYYSYNTDGTVSGSSLSDWAGKDWTWVEADISAFQMPLDVCRAYTVRVTSPQNCTKGTGYLYLDNIQFIYGTNTNDVTNPVLESVTETGSGTVLANDGSTVLSSGSLSFSATYSDSELTDKYATGIDKRGIRVLLDGVDHTEAVEINEGSLYLMGMNLRNGTHTLTIRLKDFYGNVTTESRTFVVEDEVGTEAGIAVLPQPEAPEIGKEFALWIVNQTGEDLIKAELVIDLPAKYLQNAKVEALGDYKLTLDSSALGKGQARITIEKKPAMRLFTVQAASYDYASELGYLVITIPENAASDAELSYTVSKGDYTTMSADGKESRNSFSGTVQQIPLTADYQISCTQAVAGMPATITVADANGTSMSRMKVYNGETLLGQTNLRGQLNYTFASAGEYTICAKGDKGRSWDLRVIVCNRTEENGGKPFGILTNGIENGATGQSISWLSAIDSSAAKAQVRYSTNEALSEATVAEGVSTIVCFVQSSTGDALRSNRVRISGLSAGTTYYYQVGDGSTWSETHSFRTASPKGDANFFILGDIQSKDTANLAAVLSKLKGEDTVYDFAIQTGDAVDNATDYTAYWRSFLTTVNSKTLDGTDLIHVMGNHEYYGDAEGKISGSLYDLPDSTQNSWYKMEYGKVCVVVVNNGAKLAEALADIAANLKTDCIWKLLVAHAPIYGTNHDSAAPSAAMLASIEQAGFDFVLGGDDHAYARTKPMLGGQVTEDAHDGVVYYVCGDLSGKSNAFKERDCYDIAIPHNDYVGMYMTATADEASMTINAYKYNGELLDSYTKQRTDCELGKHTFDETSKYDMANHTASCVLCGQQSSVPATFSGLLETTDGAHVVLANGVPKKNQFTSFVQDIFHSCANGYAYKAVHTDDRTCTKGGRTKDTCPKCNATQESQFLNAEGHAWDENHICKKCQFQGIDIAGADVVFKFGTPENPRDLEPIPQYAFKDGGVRPSSFAKHGNHVLTSSNDNNTGSDGVTRDLYVQWPENKYIGKATIRYEGRGNYYGEKVLTYIILPDSVTTLTVQDVTETSATLTWNAAPGAQYYEVFSCDEHGESRRSLGNVTECSFVLNNLAQDKTTYYVVASRAKDVNDKVYNCAKWSPVCAVSAAPISADVTAMSAVVDGMTIPTVAVDGVNYLFLPASADLAALNVTFTRSSEQGKLTVSGSKGSVVLGDGDTLDVAALAAESDSYRTIKVQVGNGAAFTVRVMQATNLATVYLTSSDNEKGRGFVDANKANVAQAALKMVDANGQTISETGIEALKARGNSTFAHAAKKSYQMKLSAPSDLLQNSESVKTWVLLANYFDATMMHDKLFKDLAAAMQMPYTASCDWVNLYYDGEYRGVYLLSEKNTIKSTGVDITDLEAAYKDKNPGYGTNMVTAEGKNTYGGTYYYTTGLIEPENIAGGYLIELNHNKPDEANGFITTRGKGFNAKSPEWCGQEAMKYISEYYQAFEDAVYAQDENGNYTGVNAAGMHYYDYVDKESLVKIFLLQELALNPDGFMSSLFFYKDANGKMYAGPIWDQDMTLGTGWTKYLAPDVNYAYHYLAEALIQIPDFRDAVNRYYTETFASMARSLLDNNGTIAQYEQCLNSGAAMNYTLWPYIRVGDPAASGYIWQGATYASVTADMRDWLAKRITQLDSVFAGVIRDVGDVNGDGKVDEFDAVAILRYEVGYQDSNFDIRYADVNKDGSVDGFDAVAILRSIVGYKD